MDAGSYLEPSRELCIGDPSQALNDANHVLDGEIYISGQKHFYLETQACLVVPKGTDNQLEIFSSTESITETQVH